MSAGLISTEIYVRIRVSSIFFTMTMIIEAVKTMTMTYILICIVLLAIIGGLYYYRSIIKSQIEEILASRRNQQVNPDLDSIIGNNPEPALQGRFGRDQRPSGSKCSIQ